MYRSIKVKEIYAIKYHNAYGRITYGDKGCGRMDASRREKKGRFIFFQSRRENRPPIEEKSIILLRHNLGALKYKKLTTPKLQRVNDANPSDHSF